jgi:predicted HAD superfamily phosphohydrolase
MSKPELQKGLGVIAQGLRHMPDGQVRYLAGDTRSYQKVQAVCKVGQVKLVGGGGTNMGRLVEEVCESKPCPDAIICVTDGYTPWPNKRVRTRLVVALTDNPGDRYPVPAWATKIILD